MPLSSALLETLCHNSLHLDRMPVHYLSARMRRLTAAPPPASGLDFYDLQVAMMT